MARAQQINVDAFDKLNEKIKEVYGNLVKLDTKVDPVIVKRFTEIATGVNQLANAVIKLGKAADNDLKASSARLKTLFQEIQKLDKVVAAAGKLDGTTIIKFSNSIYRFTLAMKEAGTIVLSNNPMKNLTDAIETFIKSFKVTKNLGKIEKELEAFASLIKKLYAAFTKVSTGPPLDLKSLKTILAFYTSFQSTLTKSSSGNMAAVEKDLAVFASIIKKLSSTLQKASATPINSAALQPLLDFYKAFLRSVASKAAAPGTMAALSKDFADFFKAITSILRSISKLNLAAVNIAGVQSGVKDLIDLYNSFQVAFASSASSTTAGTAASTSATISTKIDEFKKIIRDILSIIKIIPTNKINTAQLKQLETAFVEIMKFYQKFSDIVSKQADNSTATLTAKVLNGLGAVLTGIGSFFASRNTKGFLGSIQDLIVFRLALGQAVVVMRNIIKTTDGMSDVRIEAVSKFAKGMGAVLTGLSDFFKVVTSGTFFNFSISTFIQRIVQIRLGLIPLGLVLDKLRPLFKNAKDGDVSAVAGFTKAVASIFNAITSLFELFSKRENGASYGTIAKVWLALQVALKPIINFLGQLRKLPKNIDFNGLNTIFVGLTGFVTQISKLAQASSGKETNVKSIKTQLNAVIEIMNLKGLRKLGKGTELKSVAVAMTAMVDLIKSLVQVSEIGDIKKLNDLNSLKFTWLTNLAKEFKNAAQYVKGLDPKAIRDIETAYKALVVMSTADTGKLGSTLGTTDQAADNVSEGFFNATLRLRLFDFAVNAVITTVKALNPAALVGYFISVYESIQPALQRLREFGGQIKDFGNNLKNNFGLEAISNSNLFEATVQFDKLGSSLEVFGGFTKEQRAEAEEFANVLGKDYPLSANEALKALLDLTKAGQSLDSAKIILPAAADLASLSDSGSIEAATAAIIQINAAFKNLNDTTATSFENSALAVDILAAAADSSTASVESLAAGLANVGPVANQFGLTLEETAAILAIFSDGGIKGAEAGTQLKSLLTNLTTDAAQKELRKLGVAYTDTAGNIRDIGDIITDINTKFTQSGSVTFKATRRLSADQQAQLDAATKAYASAQRTIQATTLGINAAGAEGGERAANSIADAQKISDNAANAIASITGNQQDVAYITREIRRTEAANAESLKNIAGSYGQAGLAILLNQGADGLDEFIQKMREVEPAAVRARQALDNMAGDVIQLQGSVETLGTRFLGPMLEKFFRPFVKIGRFVADTFLSIDVAVFDFAATAVGLLATFASIIGILGVIVGAVIQLGAAVGGLGAFWVLSQKVLTGAVLAGLAGFAAGILSLAAAFVVLTPIIGAVTSVFNSLYRIFTEDIGGAATALQAFGTQIGLVFSDIGNFVGQFFTLLTTVVSGPAAAGLEGAGAGIAGFFNFMAAAIAKSRESGVLKYLTDLAQVFQLLTAKFTLFDRTEAAGNQAAADAGDNDSLGRAGKQARAVAKARLGVSDEYAKLIADMAKNNAIVRALFTDGTDVTSEGVQSYLNARLDALTNIKTKFIDIFKAGFAGAALASLLNPGDTNAAITGFFNGVISNLDNSVGDLAGAVLDAIQIFAGFDFSLLSNIFKTKGLDAGVEEAMSGIDESIRTFFTDNRDSIKSALTWVFEKLALSTLGTLETVFDLLGLGNIADIFEGIIDTITDIFGRLIDTFINLATGQDIFTALKNAFGPGIEPILNFVKELGRTIDLTIGTIGRLFAALFPPSTAVATSGAGRSVILDTINTVIIGLTSFLKFFNDTFLVFLSKGDFSGIFSNIGKVLKKAVDEIGRVIGDLFKSINGEQILKSFGDIAGSIIKGIGQFLKTIFSVDYLKAFKGLIDGVIKAAGDIIGAIFSAIKGIFSGGGDSRGGGNVAQQFDLGTAISDFLTGLVGNLKNIDKFLGDLASQFLTTLSKVFNFTDFELFKDFKKDGFIAGMRKLLSRLINGIVSFITTNAPKVINAFLGFGKSIAESLKLDGLVDFFDNLMGFVDSIFQGNNIGDALLEAFGPGIQPVVDFIKSLETAAADVVKFVQSIIDAIFNPTIPGGESPVTIAINGIIAAFQSVVAWIQTNILGPLAAGDLQTAISGLAAGALNLVTGIANGLTDAINSLDLPGVFGRVATAIIEGIVSVISSGLNTLVTLSGFDASSFLSALGSLLDTGISGYGTYNTYFNTMAASIIGLIGGAISFAIENVASLLGFDASNFLDGLDILINNAIKVLEGGSFFTLVAGTIEGLLATALGGIFDIIGGLTGIDPDAAFKKITDALSNFMDSLTEMFTGENSIIDSVATIIERIVGAFQGLLALFAGEGGAAAAGPAAANPVTVILQAVVDLLAQIAAIGLNSLSDFIDGITSLFNILAEANSGQILLIAGAIGVLVLELKGIAAISTLSSVVTSIGTLFSIMRAPGGFAFIASNALPLLKIGLTGLANITGFTSFVTYFKDFLFFVQTYGLKATLFNAVGNGLAFVSKGLTLLANSIVGKAAAILVIFQAFRALATNLDSVGKAFKSLTELDIAGFLSSAIESILGFGADLAFNILEMLGIDNLFGVVREDFTRIAAIIGAGLNVAFRAVGTAIEQFITSPLEYLIQVTIPLMMSNLKEVAIRAAAALGDTEAKKAVAGFDLADSITFDKNGFGATIDGVAQNVWAQGLIDSLTLAGPDAIFRAQINAKAGFDAISGIFITEMQRTDILPEDQALFLTEQVRAFNFLGILDEALIDVANSGDTALLQNFLTEAFNQGITITPEMTASLGQSIREGFSILDTGGALGRIDQLGILIDQFTLAGLDPAELIKIRDDLQKQIDEYQAAGGVPPVEVDTNVDATVGDTTITNPGDVPGGVQGAVEGAVPADGVAVDVPVQVRPKFGAFSGAGTDAGPIDPVTGLQQELDAQGFGFDLATLGDPAAVESFDQLVLKLSQDVVTLAAELNGLPTTQILVTTSLEEIATQVTAFRDLTVPMFGEVQLAVDPIKTGIDSINSSLTALFINAGIGFPILTGIVTFAVITMSVQFAILRSAADANLTAVVAKVNDLAKAFTDASKAATALTNNPAFNTVAGTGGTSGGTGIGEGKAEGGPVFPRMLYPFLEKKVPEMLTIGNKTYLATPKAGMVTPLTDMSSSRRTGAFGNAAQPKASAAGSTNAGTSVTIVEGAIHVTVSGANVSNENQLVSKIVRQISDLQDRNNKRLSDRLRTTHR